MVEENLTSQPKRRKKEERKREEWASPEPS
jgi:hypothetical protein